MAKKKKRENSVSATVAADVKRMSGKPAAALAAVSRWLALDPAAVAEGVRAAWSSVKSPADRQQLMKAVFHARHPAALEVLHLGMSDPDTRTRGWAAEFVAGVAFRDFRKDPRGYAAWHAATGNEPLEDVARASARSYVERLGRTPQADRAEATRGLIDTVRTGSVGALADAGLVRLLTAWIAAGDTEVAENALRVLHRFPLQPRDTEQRVSSWIASRNEAVARAALRHLPEFAVSEAFLRANVVPAIRSRPALRASALRALGRKGASWALEILLPWLSDSDDDAVLAAAEALAEIGDPRAIPAMVEALRADPSRGRLYNIGNFGLALLTGVEYEATHDGAWWEKWLLARRPPERKRARR